MVDDGTRPGRCCRCFWTTLVLGTMLGAAVFVTTDLREKPIRPRGRPASALLDRKPLGSSSRTFPPSLPKRLNRTLQRSLFFSSRKDRNPALPVAHARTAGVAAHANRPVVKAVVDASGGPFGSDGSSTCRSSQSVVCKRCVAASSGPMAGRSLAVGPARGRRPGPPQGRCPTSYQWSWYKPLEANDAVRHLPTRHLPTHLPSAHPPPSLVPAWSLTCDLGWAGQQRAWAACGARHRGAARVGRGGGGTVAAKQLACARAPQRRARAPPSSCSNHDLGPGPETEPGSEPEPEPEHPSTGPAGTCWVCCEGSRSFQPLLPMGCACRTPHKASNPRVAGRSPGRSRAAAHTCKPRRGQAARPASPTCGASSRRRCTTWTAGRPAPCAGRQRQDDSSPYS